MTSTIRRTINVRTRRSRLSIQLAAPVYEPWSSLVAVEELPVVFVVVTGEPVATATFDALAAPNIGTDIVIVNDGESTVYTVIRVAWYHQSQLVA